MGFGSNRRDMRKTTAAFDSAALSSRRFPALTYRPDEAHSPSVLLEALRECLRILPS